MKLVSCCATAVTAVGCAAELLLVTTYRDDGDEA
jgi:hypothetical protein